MRSVKISCVTLFVIFGGIAALTNRPFIQQVDGFSGGPPAGHTGAPLESDCSQCHANNQGSGEFRLVIPTNYVPGRTYQIVVQHATADVTRRRWGFQLTTLAGLKPAGSFQSRDVSTQTVPGLTRQYIQHTSAGTFPGQSGAAQWIFDWTAPAKDEGTITFYAAGNQADNSGTPDGDQIYYALAESMPGQPSPTPTPSITPTPTPSAQFTISGRVLTPNGQGLRNAVVTMTDPFGIRRVATTGSFGVFVFGSVLPGSGYVISVSSKRYRFAPRTVSVSGDRSDIDFVGLE